MWEGNLRETSPDSLPIWQMVMSTKKHLIHRKSVSTAFGGPSALHGHKCLN